MPVDRLAVALGHAFADDALLLQALTHRSFGTPHNERLEFLGDSILNCVIAATLFLRFASLREGELSRLRANLVRQEALADIAAKLDLGSHLRLGEGELKSGGYRRPSILADALEAVFGAVYLDGGFTAAEQVIGKLYAELLDGLDPNQSSKDPKTALQELLQGRKLPLPVYAMLSVQGEAHAQAFEVECRIPAFGVLTRGSGNSRRAAEQAAAREALVAMKGKA